jgi:homoserine dehydrogenase
VRKAWELGYTEPDPRDDLSGKDVARKALILARTLGYRAEPDEIKLEPLFHDDGVHANASAFIASLGALDDAYRERIERARQSGKVLRYVAKIRSRAISVGIEAVPTTSPLAHLRGTDNQVAIYSKRYKTNPLVVTGPGAGAKVTAAGVLNDIVAIAMEERRRRPR